MESHSCRVLHLVVFMSVGFSAFELERKLSHAVQNLVKFFQNWSRDWQQRFARHSHFFNIFFLPFELNRFLNKGLQRLSALLKEAFID